MKELYEFETSDEYIKIAEETIHLKNGVGYYFKGQQVKVKGNLETIVVKNFNTTYIEVVYNLKSDALYKDQRKLFLVENTMADRIRKDAVTNTGIEFIAEYTGRQNEIGTAELKVAEIVDMNTDLVFNKYYCSGCKKYYGLRVYNEYPTDKYNYCPICGEDLTVVKNPYNLKR